VTVVVKDLGFNALMKRLQRMAVSSLTVGVHEDAGETEDGLTTAQVAGFQEFGTINVPERSFLRSTLDTEETQIAGVIKDVSKRVISNRRRLGSRRALGIIGLDITRRIQARIRGGIPPALVSRQGTPLIDTGQLIQSITFKVF